MKQPQLSCIVHGMVPAEWIPCPQCGETGHLLEVETGKVAQCDRCHGNGGWYGCEGCTGRISNISIVTVVEGRD